MIVAIVTSCSIVGEEGGADASLGEGDGDFEAEDFEDAVCAEGEVPAAAGVFAFRAFRFCFSMSSEMNRWKNVFQSVHICVVQFSQTGHGSSRVQVM